NTIHFIYIGQIEKHKGILFLIKTFYQLPVTSYQLLIVGNGSQLNNAKALAEPNPRIKFHPWQSKEKDRKFLKQADYLIVPSLCYENSPTVIFEALKVGTPVIASNLGGIPELIQDRINGYLFTAGDENSLKNILKKVII
ncbi:glycosyltransferase, partial [Patescibacteria group bacterium]|nr:glycosyltransferase [Patescibacteria group bacterium]